MSKQDVLKSYVPHFISESMVFQEIYSTQGVELDDLSTAIDDVMNQCFIDTATWGLKFWEQFLGIPVDEGKDTGYRRSVIKSKVRGVGTVTVNLIKSVSESYSNGQVDIIEHPDNYSFVVKFVGARGIPPNLDDLKASIDSIKPAHIDVTYEFTYTTWGEVKNATWAQVKAGTWGELKTRSVV